MKKFFLNLVIIFTLSISLFSCKKKEIEVVKDLEVNTSKVLNIGKINQNTTVLVGSYAVYNSTQELRTVYGLNVQFINYDGLIDYISYKSINSQYWTDVYLSSVNGIVNVIFNQTLRVNENTPFVQIKIHTTNFVGISNPLVVWMKIHSIMTDKGSVIPIANSEISFAIGG